MISLSTQYKVTKIVIINLYDPDLWSIIYITLYINITSKYLAI